MRARIWAPSSFEKRSRLRMTSAMRTPGLDVAVEADAVAGTEGMGRLEGGRFTDVVEQHAPGEGRRGAGRQVIEQHEGMDPDVALGMVLGRLLDAAHSFDLWQDDLRGGRLRGGARRRGAWPSVSMRVSSSRMRSFETWVSSEACRLMAAKVSGSRVRPSRAAKRMPRSMRSLSSSKRRLGDADGAEDAGGEVVLAADEVEDGFGADVGLRALVGEAGGIEEHAIDGEIAPEHIFTRVDREADSIGAASVQVSAVIAEGGDFGGDGLAVDLGKYKNDAEVSADGLSARKEGGDAVGRGAGGYVEVLGLETEEEVADAAAGKVGLRSGRAQRLAMSAGGGECGCAGEAQDHADPKLK